MVDISVVVPIFNDERYLSECLDSLLNQTFTNFEIICVDDGSTDKSVELIKRYNQRDDRITIVQHEANKGLSEARNSGIRNARGKYILFVDSDDMIEENTLKELFKCAEENDLDEIIFDMHRIYESGVEQDTNESKYKNKKHEGIYTGRELFCVLVDENNIKVEACRRFLRRAFLYENNIWFYKGILHEDNLFSFYCDMYAKRVKEINKEYYVYRQRPNSIMRTINIKSGKSLFVILNEIYRYWTTHEFSEREHRMICKYFQQLYALYRYYIDIFQDSEYINELGMGSLPMQSLYTMLTKPIFQYVEFSKEQIMKLKNSKFIILYGAGHVAREVVLALKQERIVINAVAVSSPKNNSSVFCGYAVEDIKNLVSYKEYATVIIGATNKYKQEMEQYISQLGFNNIVRFDTPKRSI